MKRFAAVASILLAVCAVACGDDDSGSTTSSTSGAPGSSGLGGSSDSGQSSTGSTSTSTSKFTCRLNSSCYECPSTQAVIDCAKSDVGPSKAGCTSAAASVCGK